MKKWIVICLLSWLMTVDANTGTFVGIEYAEEEEIVAITTTTIEISDEDWQKARAAINDPDNPKNQDTEFDLIDGTIKKQWDKDGLLKIDIKEIQ